MMVVLLMPLLYYSGNCFIIPVNHPSYNTKLLECVTDIVEKYLSEKKVVTYVGNKAEDEELLQAINTQSSVTVVSRRSSKKLLVPHEAYLIAAKNATYFAERFRNVTKESTWNPNARFVIMVKALQESHLRVVFDTFLDLHANNVVIINATEEAHLYTYNPFDNYGCGKSYDTVVSYGKCLNARSINLFPEKIVTGLENCTLSVLVNHWPPYTIIPTNESDKSSVLRYGAEPYLFRLIVEMVGFKVDYVQDLSDGEQFPTVSNDMEAIGSLKLLQDNQVDVVLGGMLLTPSRAVAFSYIFGHLAYTDEIRFVVKRASNVPAWKNIYLEFESTVWVLLILSLMLYSMFIVVLIRSEDKSSIVLMLLDNLVLHGRHFRCRWVVKYVLVSWAWFAYLVNTFYQSSLVSLYTNPAQEYQISKEEDIVKYQLKPCFSFIMGQYYVESMQSGNEYHRTDGCHGWLESIKTVMKSKDSYTILLNGLYLFNEQEFFDDYGNSLVKTLPKPYSKVIYSIYLYKGFPMINKISTKSIQLRESGLVDKIMSDVNYLQLIKHQFRKKEFRGRFTIPWAVYIFGCVLAIITFVIEVMSK